MATSPKTIPQAPSRLPPASQQDIEISPSEDSMEDDTLAHHTAYTVQEPCRAEEMENGNDNAWDVAKVEGSGEDAEYITEDVDA